MYASGAGTYVSAAHTTVREGIEEAAETVVEGSVSEPGEDDGGRVSAPPAPSSSPTPRRHASPIAAGATSPARSNTPSAYTHPREGSTSTRRNTAGAIESRADAATAFGAASARFVAPATSPDSAGNEPELEPEAEPEPVTVAATNTGSAEPTTNTSAATSSRVVVVV